MAPREIIAPGGLSSSHLPRNTGLSLQPALPHSQPLGRRRPDYSVSLHADDLIGAIEALHLAPANMVGNSFGAYTALAAAIRRPNLMCKLVISEPPILPLLKEIPAGGAYWDAFMENTWLPAPQAFQDHNLEQGVPF
jgi:pimeloyl-ACP methyl ester carboxylesterase